MEIMLFTSVAGVGLTLVASGVAQNTLYKKGKAELAETLDIMTKGSVLLYAAYFLWKLLQASTVFLM
jgi:hypothetical protein